MDNIPNISKRPLKEAKRRSKQFNQRATEEELAFIKDLTALLYAKKKIGNSQFDCVMYCIYEIYRQEDDKNFKKKKRVNRPKVGKKYG